MKKRNFILSVTVMIMMLSSCQKVITIDLNKTNPQLVIDAHINDQNEPCTVLLSQTTDYFTPGAYPTISGAKIIITDQTANTSETLTETISGTYISSQTKGITGHTYVLNISWNGKTYTAQSTMPGAVEIDSISYEIMKGGNGGPGPGPGGGPRERISLRGYFPDPAGTDNYYAMHFYRNDSLLDSNRYILYSDKLVDGKQGVVNFRGRIHHGDSATMELQSIAKSTYDFYRTSNDILDRGDQVTSAAPSNPVTNVSAGAVGYFSAYSTRKKKIFIP